MRNRPPNPIVAALFAEIGHRQQRVEDAVDSLCEAIEELTKGVRAIQPAKVDLTQEMADYIVRKIQGPLTIGREFSAWIAEQAHGHDVLTTFQIGYGNDAARGYMRLKADGKLNLEIMDMNGAMMWMGTFVPPGGSS